MHANYSQENGHAVFVRLMLDYVRDISINDTNQAVVLLIIDSCFDAAIRAAARPGRQGSEYLSRANKTHFFFGRAERAVYLEM